MFAVSTICFLLVFVIYAINKLFYWKKRNVATFIPSYPYLKALYYKDFSVLNIYKEFYLKSAPRRYIGTYVMLTPSLLLRDLDLIKKISAADFNHFTDHYSFINKKGDPYNGSNLFEMSGDEWHKMRSICSPAFSSIKLKSMFKLMEKNVANFTDCLEQKIQKECTQIIDIKSLVDKCISDNLTNCLYSLNSNSFITEEKSGFDHMVPLISKPTWWTTVRTGLFLFFPKMFEILKIPILPHDIQVFFSNLFETIIEKRNNLDLKPNDLLQLLIKARNNSTFTDDQLSVQIMVFFFAGLLTSSTTITCLCYELGKCSRPQDKLQKEIDEEIAKSKNGKISYESLLKMKYLDQSVNEALRKWPPVYGISRGCTKDYVIEPELPTEKSLLIEKGTMVTIPVVGIHYDPEYFENPEEFYPERFENEENIVPGSFFPFGIGPRLCIGYKFAQIIIKLVIVQLLKNYTILNTEKTHLIIENKITTEVQSLWVGLKRR